jgi:hypothetical protein
MSRWPVAGPSVRMLTSSEQSGNLRVQRSSPELPLTSVFVFYCCKEQNALITRVYLSLHGCEENSTWKS